MKTKQNPVVDCRWFHPLGLPTLLLDSSVDCRTHQIRIWWRSRKCQFIAQRFDWRERIHNSQGQAMVEYLIVGLAIIAIVAALSAIGSAIGDGLFVEHAADSASHSVTTNTAGSIGDVLLF